MTQKAIPASVLAILKHCWKEADPNYSSFDAVFNGRADKGRRDDPSYYHIRPGAKRETEFDVFDHTEAVRLVHEEVFGTMAEVQDGGRVVVNEHVQHALTDFCGEVYSAWEKYLRRIEQVENACPPLK